MTINLRRAIAFIADFFISYYLCTILANSIMTYVFHVDFTTLTTSDEILNALGTQGQIVSFSVALLFGLVYYLVVPVFIFKGQTLMMKLPISRVKAVTKDGETPSIKTLLLHFGLGVVVLQSGILGYQSYLILLMNTISGSKIAGMVITYSGFVGIASAILILFTKEKRGLQELIAKTKFIEAPRKIKE